MDLLRVAVMTGVGPTSLDKLPMSWWEWEQKKCSAEVTAVCQVKRTAQGSSHREARAALRCDHRREQWARGSDSDSNKGQMNRLIAQRQVHGHGRFFWANKDFFEILSRHFGKLLFSWLCFLFFMLSST